MNSTLTSITSELEPSSATSSSHWIQLCPFGEFPHSNLNQVINFKSAENLVSRFNHNQQPLPIYIGHPDDPELNYQPDHKDGTPYGYIQKLSVTPEGLHFQADWTSQGLALLKSKKYQYLSPRWFLEATGLSTEGKETYSPTELVSIGLTNNPNLPSPPLPFQEIIQSMNNNEEISPFINKDSSPSETKTEDFTTENSQQFGIPEIASLLGIAPNASSECMHKKLSEHLEHARLWIEQSPSFFEKIKKVQEDADYFHNLYNGTEKKLLEAYATTEVERKARIEAELSKAVHLGQIPVHKLSYWKENFEKDLHKSLEELNSTPPPLPTQSRTYRLKQKSALLDPQAKFIDLVHDHMRQTGDSYPRAWNVMKQKQCELFSQFDSPLPFSQD